MRYSLRTSEALSLLRAGVVWACLLPAGMGMVAAGAPVMGAALLWSIPASAELRDFADFSIDLPAEWTVEREGITVAFIAQDKSATMLVTVETTVGMSARDLAFAYAEELHGSVPEQADGPNYYSFTFTSPEGQSSEASIVVSGNHFYLITISGKHKDFAAMVESVLLSIL